MQQEIIRTLGEWGTRQPGSARWLGSYVDGTITESAKIGEIYHWECQTQFLPDVIIEAVHGSILSLQETFTGLEVLFYKVERGKIVLQFRYPNTATNKLMMIRPFAISLVAIIAIVIVVILLFVVLDKLGVLDTGFGVLFDIVPGIVVTVIGGVVVSILPGKTKLAGLPVVGVGLFMMMNTFLGRNGVENGNGNGNGIPRLINPPARNASWYKGFPVKFEWTEVSGATSYDLWFNGQNFLEEIIDTGGTPYWTLVSDAAGVHKWKVRAKFGSDVGGWSETRSFIII